MARQIIKKQLKRIGFSTLALMMLTAEIIDDMTGLTSVRGRKGVYDFARKMDADKYSFRQTLRELEEGGLIKNTEQGFLITPKGLKQAKEFRLLEPKSVSIGEDWDGKWRFVIFDIPERLKSKRNTFRAFLKRKGFVRLQNSVFVCPEADFDEINVLRFELGIEEYVNFIIGESNSLDDDSLLRQKFVTIRAEGEKKNEKLMKNPKKISSRKSRKKI